LAEWKERCLRLTAEFDNFKKRTARESERRAAEQKTAFVRELLPVVDNLERALASGPAQTVQQLGEGVELTLRQLTGLLSQHGIVGRDDLGKPFDPHYHEAVCVRSEPTHADHAILEVWQRGWVRGKELLRPARVVVNGLKHNSPLGNHENIQHEDGAYHG
jgi:molecular chaperone GrpE